VYHVIFLLPGPAAGTNGTFLSTNEFRRCSVDGTATDDPESFIETPGLQPFAAVDDDGVQPAGGSHARSFDVMFASHMI